jgi:hypothetical protein
MSRVDSNPRHTVLQARGSVKARLTRRLRCTRMDAVDTAGAYRLVASSLGIDAVSAAGSANGAVAVRGLAWPERDDLRASQDDLCAGVG